jgi:hypothetical protein
VENHSRIFSLPRVIRPRHPVRLGTAGPENEEVYCPTALKPLAKGGLHVWRMKTALESVKEEEPRSFRGWSGETRDVDEITIGGVPPLDGNVWTWFATTEATPDCRDMRVLQPPGWLIRTLRHGFRLAPLHGSRDCPTNIA